MDARLKDGLEPSLHAHCLNIKNSILAARLVSESCAGSRDMSVSMEHLQPELDLADPRNLALAPRRRSLSAVHMSPVAHCRVPETLCEEAEGAAEKREASVPCSPRTTRPPTRSSGMTPFQLSKLSSALRLWSADIGDIPVHERRVFHILSPQMEFMKALTSVGVRLLDIVPEQRHILCVAAC